MPWHGCCRAAPCALNPPLSLPVPRWTAPQVDRAFSLYCTIDPLAGTLGINIYQFTQFLRDTEMTDAHVSRAGIALSVCSFA